ncbi:MAG: matrixin family metalloprotease [Vampirovibrionales bacterium]
MMEKHGMAPSTHLPTYLAHCLNTHLCMRWPQASMPLSVYIAPFRWHEAKKQARAEHYMKMVWGCFLTWQQASQQQVRFRRVATLQESQINVEWRRINRTSLGHCQTSWTPDGRIYSAEISIGLTEGKLVKAYDNDNEVKHTVLHEIGHALGLLGHSNHPADIMFVPHQYGVYDLSPRDIATLMQLYQLPAGFNYIQTGKQLGLHPPFGLDDVLQAQQQQSVKQPTFASIQHQVVQQQQAAAPPIIHTQQETLAQRGQFLLATSFIQPKPPALIVASTSLAETPSKAPSLPPIHERLPTLHEAVGRWVSPEHQDEG